MKNDREYSRIGSSSILAFKAVRSAGFLPALMLVMISMVCVCSATYAGQPRVGKASLPIGDQKVSANRSSMYAALPDPSQRGILVASADVPTAPAQEGVVSASTSRPHSGNVSLDFVGSDIHDVLKALAMQTGANIIAGPEVTGNVTISLKNVSVEDALKLITSISGFKYEKVNGTYLVGTPASLQAASGNGASIDGTGSESAAAVLIRYSNLDSLLSLLSKQFPSVRTVVGRGFNAADGGSSQAAGSNGGGSGSTNSPSQGAIMLVLAGPAGDVNAAKSVIQDVESSLGTISQEMVIDTYEVRFGNVHDMRNAVMNYIPGVKVMVGPGAYDFDEKPNGGIKATYTQQSATSMSGSGGSGGQSQSSSGGSGNSSNSGSSSSTSSQGGTDSLMNLLVIQGRKQDVERAKAFLAKLDVPENQIMLEAKIVDVNESAVNDLGIDWSWNQERISEEDVDPVGTPSADQGLISGVHLGRFNRTPLEIYAKINALITQGKGKVLASPNVCVMDRKQANIFIGDQVTYVSLIQQTPQGQNIQTQTQNIGVGLLATCRITSDGYIIMSLHPNVSVITGWLNVPGGGQLPQVSTREIDSIVRVKNGQTLVIGGLLKDDDITNISKTPILSSLPILGELFKHKTKTKDHSEVMMFITPRILGSN